MLLKRLTDILLAALVLGLFAPWLLLLCALICLDSKGSAIFRQKRIGRDGVLFDIYKFRTMSVGTPDLPTDQMMLLPSPVTRIGALLRRTSLDELPQLVNVLTGEMS